MKTIGFIGAGNMAGGIIAGIRRAELAMTVTAYDIDSVRLDSLRKSYEITPAGSIRELTAGAGIVVLAVKPQSFGEVLPEMKSAIRPGTVVVSIAAGVTSDYIASMLGMGGNMPAKIVRVMPNTPLMLGVGATALAAAPAVTAEEFALVRSLFDCSGVTAVLPETQMNEVIPVNGSSPAFLYYFAKCFVEYGANAGIGREDCLRLFAQTMIGSAKMLTESGKSIDELIEMVSSKGGTTIAGLEALRAGGLEQTVRSCCEQCVKRARELECKAE